MMTASQVNNTHRSNRNPVKMRVEPHVHVYHSVYRRGKIRTRLCMSEKKL